MSKMWVLCSPEKNIALYQYRPGRKGQVAKEMLEIFSGYLQTDSYSGYNAVEDVPHVGCWTYVRRKWVDCFVDKKPADGSKSQKAFEYIDYYNNRRIKLILNGLSPVQYRIQTVQIA